MRKRPCLMSALLATFAMTSGCATARPSPVPRLTLPSVASEPCRLTTLPAEATLSDLDRAYAARATDLALCEGKRALAVEAFDAQQRALTPLPRPFWARLFGG